MRSYEREFSEITRKLRRAPEYGTHNYMIMVLAAKKIKKIKKNMCSNT